MTQPLFQNEEYQGVYNDLYTIAQKGVTALPFVPSVPPNWAATQTKVLWYGGATDGWDEAQWPETFDLSIEHLNSRKWLEQKFEDRNMRSPFWRVQKRCLSSLGLTLDNAAWSNVYKIGGLHGELRGMPPSKLKSLQSDLCVTAFEIERKMLKPDLTVLHVGSLTDLILHRIAGPWRDWHTFGEGSKPLAAYKMLDGQPVIWMSRRVSFDESYVKAFSWCCAQLGIHPQPSETSV